MADDSKNLGGRPTKYRPEYNLQARKLMLLGATVADLADFFEVNTDTIYEWGHEHPGFSEAIKTGRGDWDDMVEKSLARRAMGYDCLETQLFAYEGIVTDERTVIKHYPPETAAAIFWLKNRRPEKWRDRREVDVINTDVIKDGLKDLIDIINAPVPNRSLDDE